MHLRLRNGVCHSPDETQGQYGDQGKFKEEGMKRFLVLVLVWTLLVITGTIVSAEGQTRSPHKSERVASVITNVTNQNQNRE
jgi:cytochrome b subunit of formate dehydrogenase